MGCRVCVCAALLRLSIEDEKTYEIPPRCTGVVFTAGIIHLILERERWPLYLLGMCCVSLPLLQLCHFSSINAIVLGTSAGLEESTAGIGTGLPARGRDSLPAGLHWRGGTPSGFRSLSFNRNIYFFVVGR